MFDIGKILKRAWGILWDYKILWAFGFLMVLTGAGSSSGGGGGGSTGYRFHNSGTQNYNFDRLPGLMSGWSYSLQKWFTENIGPWFVNEQATLHTITWIIIGIAIFSVVIGLLFALVRYPAETAVMRMVDENEKTGSKVSFKQGWKLGWNIRAFRMWLIDTILATPGLIIAILIMVGILVTINRAAVGAISNINIAMFGAWVLLAIVLFLPVALLMIVLGMLRQMVVRFAAIDGLSFGESFVKGWALFKMRFKDVLITWLVMVGIGIGVGFAMILVALVLVPAYAVMVIPGTVAAAIPGAIAYAITTLFSAQVWPWIVGGLVALPVFLMVVFSPLSFVSGWVTIFSSNVWTLAFRQMKAITEVPPVLPVEEAPQA